MSNPETTRDAQAVYRTGYLKLKSALYDRTTGLPAFAVLFSELHALLDRRREIGVLHIEIANLEMVESIYGWQVFDRIVARVAGLLREAVGNELPEETLLAVNGVAGERFVAFVPEMQNGDDPDAGFLAGLSRAVCAKLDTALDEDDFAGLSPRLCFRAGQALLSENPFYRFERCVYAAVEEARLCPERRERRRELSWGEELHRIIQLASVDTLFQPLVELEGRELLGYEAFVRGPRDTLFEAPRTMFALSDRVGVATDLDRMCCEAALRAFSRLIEPGKIFLNVLPQSVEDPAWRHGHFRSLLASLELEPADVVLEISERGTDADPEPYLDGLVQFKNEGFGLALDDVGTGRGSLGAIERVRPDYLKLDVSLVRNIHESLIQQEVLATLVQLAGRIDAAVVAEGVESEAEAATLTEGGARYAQGYLFAVPSPHGRRRDTGAGERGER